jgi:glycosyltransferase involved in cell wall biosynthesis
MKKSLVIINNEKCKKIGDHFFCENLEISALSKSLSNFFNVSLFARKGNILPVHKIYLKNIYTYKNIFSFFLLFKNFFSRNTNFLIISITPFTLVSYFFLIFFSNRVFVYLRSHGDQEFRYIIGNYSIWIYKICLFLISLRAKLICVNDKIAKKKSFVLVSPSQLNAKWFLRRKLGINKKKINLLYFGRIKKEKGIYSLLNIYKNIKLDIENHLNIVGAGDKINFKSPTININPALSKVSEIINLYDANQILILPSFTEGHPQVMLEALARLRPVIIFDEIKHIKKNYYGVFISKRESKSLKKTILNIVSDYDRIQSKLKLNKLPTHSDFIKKLVKILSI